MTSILRFDSSSRTATTIASDGQGSYSRALADHIIDQIRTAEPSVEVVTRDVASNPISRVLNETVEGYYTPLDKMTLSCAMQPLIQINADIRNRQLSLIQLSTKKC